MLNPIGRLLFRRVFNLNNHTRRCYGSLDFEELEEVSDKTQVTMSSKAENVDPLFLSGYVVGGFKFKHITVWGPVAIIEGAAFSWSVKDPSEITTESLSLFSLIYPKLDMIVIGTGDKYVPLDPAVHKEIKSRGLAIEVQKTAHACGIVNLLREKSGQRIGAAMIPVTQQVHSAKEIHRVKPAIGPSSNW